jgi:hypothetical protein
MTNDIIFREAVKEDIIAWGIDPGDYWIGWVLDQNGVIKAIAVVVWPVMYIPEIKKEGVECWGIIDCPSDFRSAIFMHRNTLKVLNGLKEGGEEYVKVLREESIETSKEWLTRLGFVKTDQIVNDQEVWKIQWV